MVNDHQIIFHSYTTTPQLIWPSNVTPYVRGEEESGYALFVVVTTSEDDGDIDDGTSNRSMGADDEWFGCCG